RMSGEHEIVSPRRLRTDPAAMAPTVVDLASEANRRPSERDTPASSSGIGTFLFVLLLLGGAGAAVWHFKLRDTSSSASGQAPAHATGSAPGSRALAGSEHVAPPADASVELAGDPAGALDAGALADAPSDLVADGGLLDAPATADAGLAEPDAGNGAGDG